MIHMKQILYIVFVETKSPLLHFLNCWLSPSTMANATLDKVYPRELNQTSLSIWRTGTIVLMLTLNVFLSITASLGNALILVALRKESSLHPATKLLFRCLAVTDLCVGLISRPLHIASVISMPYHRNVRLANYASTYILCAQPNGGEIPLNIARYRKTVSSIVWVQLALVVCYAPCGVLTVLKVHEITTGLMTTNVVLTIIYFNSSTNPILYCWKIRDVIQAVKETIR